VRVGAQRVRDLHGQLARWHQHQAERLAVLGPLAAQLGQQRQAEGERLAGAGAGAAEHVAARERVRDGRGLDGERVADAASVQLVGQLGW
jgi:hypothetical protein